MLNIIPIFPNKDDAYGSNMLLNILEFLEKNKDSNFSVKEITMAFTHYSYKTKEQQNPISIRVRQKLNKLVKIGKVKTSEIRNNKNLITIYYQYNDNN